MAEIGNCKKIVNLESRATEQYLFARLPLAPVFLLSFSFAVEFICWHK